MELIIVGIAKVQNAEGIYKAVLLDARKILGETFMLKNLSSSLIEGSWERYDPWKGLGSFAIKPFVVAVV